MTHFYGTQGYGAALVVDQSNFIVMCVGGIITAGIFGNGAGDGKTIFKRIINCPSIQAMALTLLLKPLMFAPWFDDLLVLGKTLTPLAMIGLGTSFKLELRKDILGHFCLGAGIKLLLIPFVILAVFYSLQTPGNLCQPGGNYSSRHATDDSGWFDCRRKQTESAAGIDIGDTWDPCLIYHADDVEPDTGMSR